MKTFILVFFLCYWGYAVATPVVPEERSTISIEEHTFQNLSTDIPMNATAVTTPPKSFLPGALSAFTVIIISELGDKTFFIAVVLALTCSPFCVFGGAISALILMTLLSAALGLVSTFIPRFWVQCLSALLFIIFGLKMAREGYLMKSTASKDELEDVKKDVDSKIASKSKLVDTESGKAVTALRWVFLEAFVMTFLAEWGDRSQITTVVLAAKDNIYGVVFGAICGHTLCTLLAVAGGRIVADRISLRIVTFFGAFLFFIFAIAAIVTALQDYLNPSAS